MFEKFKQALSQIKSAKDTHNVMRSLVQVKACIPPNAQYVTLGDMLVLEGRMQTSGIKYDNPLMYHQSVENTQGIAVSQTYMLHDGVNLRFIDGAGKTLLNTPLQNIESLESRQKLFGNRASIQIIAGFVYNLKDGRTVVISITPRPVETDPSLTFKTVTSPTDITGGWAKELSKFGIETQY